MDVPGPVELIIIAGVVLVLFGSKKLPDAARSMGRSLRIFKAETRGLREDEETGQQRPADDTSAAQGRPLEVPAEQPAQTASTQTTSAQAAHAPQAAPPADTSPQAEPVHTERPPSA